MSVQSALDYIRRMRSDEPFRLRMNDMSEDEEACWSFLRANGFEFSMTEFREAQEEIYRENGITPP